MPKLPKMWHEQLSYPKILPLESNLSIEISSMGIKLGRPRAFMRA